MAGVTCNVTEALGGAMKLEVLFGVKVTERVWGPVVSTAPFAGVYTNAPATDAPLLVAVASSWAPVRAVPYEMDAGVGHVIVGVAFVAVVDWVAEAAR